MSSAGPRVSTRIWTAPATSLDGSRSDVCLPIGSVAPQLQSGSRMEETASPCSKALGLGLSAPLTDIIVSLSERAALLSTGLRGQSASNWRLLNVPHPRAVVAVALGPHLESAAPT